MSLRLIISRNIKSTRQTRTAHTQPSQPRANQGSQPASTHEGARYMEEKYGSFSHLICFRMLCHSRDRHLKRIKIPTEAQARANTTTPEYKQTLHDSRCETFLGERIQPSIYPNVARDEHHRERGITLALHIFILANESSPAESKCENGTKTVARACGYHWNGINNIISK